MAFQFLPRPCSCLQLFLFLFWQRAGPYNRIKVLAFCVPACCILCSKLLLDTRGRSYGVHFAGWVICSMLCVALGSLTFVLCPPISMPRWIAPNMCFACWHAVEKACQHLCFRCMNQHLPTPAWSAPLSCAVSATWKKMHFVLLDLFIYLFFFLS